MPGKEQDRLEYRGGHQGYLTMFRGGKVVWEAKAVSGQPGFPETEKNLGPIPKHTYWVRNQPARLRVMRVMKTDGLTSARIDNGIQEVPDRRPDSSLINGELLSFWGTRDIWGLKRLRIEGKKHGRTGFYIHGGSPSHNVTKGCIKVPSPDAGGFFREFSKYKPRKRIPLYVN